MAEHQLKRIRPLGKLEEISAAAHHIDFFTNTGISVHYKAADPSLVTDLERTIHSALAEVLRLHPILFAIPVSADTTQPYWGRLPEIDLKKVVSIVERSSPFATDDEGRDKELDTLLEQQHNVGFKSEYGTLPVWKLVILKDHGATHQFTACFIAHHSMTDGTGLQIFQNALQTALCDVSSGILPISVDHIVFSNDDAIVPSLEELHPLPLKSQAAETDGAADNDWRGTPVQLPCRTRYESLSLAPDVMRAFAQECRKHKVAPSAALPSLLARLLYNNLEPTPESLTCNLPVSLRSDLPPKIVDGQMGNYIDAFKVKLLRSELDEPASEAVRKINSPTLSGSLGIWSHARKIQKETRQYFSNVSPSGAPYANVAIFKVIHDIRAALVGTIGTPRGESFEVSNLGTFSKPAQLANAGSAPIWQVQGVLLSRCAYAAGGPLVICVIVSDESTGFGFTWQQDAIPDIIVKKVITDLRMYLTSLPLVSN